MLTILIVEFLKFLGLILRQQTMPRGKYTRKNKRNENSLTTRLLEISMKVDDFVYMDKLITTSEAAAYLKEIATLKLRCLPTNIHALQVIEKLTRHMTNILTEDGGHTSSFNAAVQIATQFVGSASPVYSLPDEDRAKDIYSQNKAVDFDTTHFSDDEVTKKEKNISQGQTNSCNRQDVANVRQIGDSTCPENTLDDIEVMDITEDIEEVNPNVLVSNEPHVSIEHVNTGLSNMIIQDDDPTCSQSILDDYTNEMKTENAGKEKGGIVMKSREDIEAKTRLTTNVNNYFKTSDAIPSQTTYAPLKEVINETAKTTFHLDSQPISQTHVPENTNNKRGIKNADNRKDKKQKTKHTKDTKTTVDKTQNYLQRGAHSASASIDVSKNKHNDKITVKKPKNRKKTHEIYNENVENDLSWVENLRYVREISPSEHDPALALLPDNFWENFTQPGTLCDLDFEV